MIINKTVLLIWRSRRLQGGVLVLLLVLVGIAVVGYQVLAVNKPDAGHWVAVQSEPLVHQIGLVGKIEPHETITLTAPFEGNVQVNLVEQGQRVEEGQTLLTMDPALIEIQLRDALSAQLKARRIVQELKDWDNSAQVARARRALRTSEMSVSNLDRKLRDSRNLLERGIIPRNELDDLNQQAQMQRFELVAAQGELQQVLDQGGGEYRQIAEMELTNATVKYEGLRTLLGGQNVLAPFTGIVVPVSTSQISGASAMGPLQAGTKVSQGQVLFGLANIEQLKIVTTVSELDINQLHQGQDVEILGDGFEGERLSGSVQIVSRLAVPGDDSSGGAKFPVTLSIPKLTHEQLQRVRLGMSARLAIVTYRNDQAIIIPPAAIQRDGHARMVEYREGIDQPIERLSVTTGRSTLKGVEVFGLQPGFVRLQNQMPSM